MRNKLVATGLYTLDSNSNTSEELKAFAQELDVMFDMLDEMTREYFIATSQSYGITERERFIGKERSELPTEQRREMLLVQEQMMGNNCSKDAFELMLSQKCVDLSVNDIIKELKLTKGGFYYYFRSNTE